MPRRAARTLNGNVVAITGGGRGIGRAMARALAAEGARVAVCDLDGDTAAATAAELGGGAVGLAVDVTDHAALSAFLDTVEERLGPLDVLINNAGIMPVTPLVDEDDASIARQLGLNLGAVIAGNREAMRRMVPRGRGHIVNIASIAGRNGFPHLATYCATKHGVVGLSEALRAELRGTGVEITVVMPALVNTELTSGVPAARGVKTIEPEEVAAEVVAALRVPRFDVFVPKLTGRLVKLGAMLPRRVREPIARATGGDDALRHADPNARAAYEARAARSAPAVDNEFRSPVTAPQAPQRPSSDVTA
jgi:NAD(P)-dependent dehydrogenase (short-subunit alcohol dehydrogenase family)